MFKDIDDISRNMNLEIRKSWSLVTFLNYPHIMLIGWQ